MSLDERIRAALRHAAELGQLREDDAFDSVRLNHRRGLVRNGVTRQAIAVAVVLTLFASVAMVVSWRNTPSRFRSTTTLRVAPASSSSATPTTKSRPLKLSDPKQVALAAEPDHAQVEVTATLNSGRDLLTLAATAPTGSEATAVARAWTSAFIKARRAEAIRALRAADLALMRRIKALHSRLRQLDARLKQIHPGYYRYLRYNPPLGHPFGDGEQGPSSPPASASARELKLYNERVQILAVLADLGAEYARTRISVVEPSMLAKLVTQTPAVRADTSSPATVPILVAWAIGLVILLAGAGLVYRRRTRSMHQVSA
jgi:hypothetical protein